MNDTRNEMTDKEREESGRLDIVRAAFIEAFRLADELKVIVNLNYLGVYHEIKGDHHLYMEALET